MNPHPISVPDALERHRQAVLVDEASFDNHNNPIDEELAERTVAAETGAFITMATAPCQSHADVQAKVDYLLNGSVGVRATMLECLGIDAYGGEDVHKALLRSLVVPHGDNCHRAKVAQRDVSTPPVAATCSNDQEGTQ